MPFALTNSLKLVRRKIQREKLALGGALAGALLLAGSFAVTWVLAAYNFSDSSIFWSRVCLIALAVGLLFRFLVKPLLFSPSEKAVGRFLEERFPSLQERLSTALEVCKPSSRVHPGLKQLIAEDAGRALKGMTQPRFYWPGVTLSSLIIVAGAVLTFLGLFFFGPEVYRYGLNRLAMGWAESDIAPLYQIAVTPGDVTVGERADVEIRAALVGFDSADVTLFARYEEQPQWEVTKMRPVADSEQFSFILFDVRDSIDYYVESEGIRSGSYSIRVSDIPRLVRLKTTLRYPAYSGLSETTIEGDANIRALKGTVVTLEVETDQPVKRGAFRFGEAGEQPLTQNGPTRLSGTFTVVRDDYYSIYLANLEDVMNPGSNEFSIEALEDQPPSLSFTAPGRDRRVTNIEEVYTEVRAEDDYGLSDLKLNYSVNGGPQQSVNLAIPRGARDATSSHLLFLEDMSLEPGDFVSYFAEARDAVNSTLTDIYFLEVEPYDREYFQSQMAGSAGMGAGNEFELSRQQKQIVVGTFALEQDKDRMSEGERTENSQTLALIQQRLQTQAQAIVDRILRRGAAAEDPRLKQMADYLTVAIQHMDPAQRLLNEVKPQEALPEEQKALQQMLRAEALFNQMQVSMAQDSGGSGASPEELADLVDLDLDKTKNQYETLQQNREFQKDQALDEAMERLKELARRQQQQVERQRRQMAQGSGSGRPSDDQLIEEAERLARELARLSRQRQELNRISQELNRAAREMRQARQSGKSDQESAMLAQQALERLREAQRSLAQQRQEQLKGEFEELQASAERLVEEQQEVIRQLGELGQMLEGQEPGQDFYRQLRGLYWTKQDLQRELQELEGNLHQSARRVEPTAPAAARELKQAGNSIRDDRIPEKMQEGSELMANGLMNMARRREESVEEDLRGLGDQIRKAEKAMVEGGDEQPKEQLQQAQQEAGSLVDKLESLRQRLQGQSGSEGPGGVESRQSADSAGSRASSGIDPQQASREWNERLNDAARLRELLKDNPELAREAASLIHEMRQFDLDRILSDQEEVARLKGQIIDGFSQLELEIARSLQGGAENMLRLVNEDEVPAEYRERVQDYYRRLAERRR